MIRVRFLRSFDDSLSALPEKHRRKVRAAIHDLLDYFSGGVKPLGLGLRKLRTPYWEIRTSLDRRIFFSLEDDLATFVLIGSHDDIRRALER